MPELPEVETIRSYLAAILPHYPVVAVKHLDARMVKMGTISAESIAHRLPGLVVQSMGRRGKYLVMGFVDKSALVIHLGMSGRLVVEPETNPWRTHTHLVLGLRDDNELRLVDPRRFGRIGYFVDFDKDRTLRLGPEPLSRAFTAQYLTDRLRGRKTPIKSLLLDQSLVAGMGNIYVDEALFDAGIHPLSPGASISFKTANRLVQSIRRVLRASIAHRGTSFSDYVDALGRPGQNQEYLAVYGRLGQPCLKCGSPIHSIVIHARTSHFCQYCQPVLEDLGG